MLEDNFLCTSNRAIGVTFLWTQVVYRIRTHRLIHRVNRVRQAKRGMSWHHGWLATSRTVRDQLLRSTCTLGCLLFTEHAASVLCSLGKVPVHLRCGCIRAKLAASGSHSKWRSHWSLSQVFMSLRRWMSAHTWPSRLVYDLSGIRWNTCYFQVFPTPSGCGTLNCSLTAGLMIQLFKSPFFFWPGDKADVALSLSVSVLWSSHFRVN